MLESAAMPLPVSEVERELTHTRRVRYEGYKRADGFWDIEAHLLDTKNHDFWLRVTIDKSFTILDAQAAMDAVPYPGGCEKIPPAYRKLIGLNLLRGFRKRSWELLGAVKGCTHLTEMLGGLPPAAIQTFAGEVPEERDDGSKPFQLDQCHALETSSETVKLWYPKWYRGKAA